MRFITTCSVAFIAFLAILVIASDCYADVTGFFETHIEFTPQTTASEVALQHFDVENDLTVNFLISGLRSSFHTHFGIGGVEDVLLTSDAAFGIVQFKLLLAFARFGPGSIFPSYSTLHFVKKQLTVDLLLGGVSFENVATYEDTNSFLTQTPGLEISPVQSPAYAFGNVLTVVGSTPSGVNITAQLAICKERVANSIKKHVLAPFSVNPDCATEPMPDILFDFERVTISSVPIADGVTGSSVIDCVRITACNLTATATISGGLVPFQTELIFRDILQRIDFSGAIVNFTHSAGSISFLFGGSGGLTSVRGVLAATLNPDTNPADGTLRFTLSPGEGLTDAAISFAITRGPMRFSSRINYGGGPPLIFEDLFFDMTVVGGGFELRAASEFELQGLVEGTIEFTLFF